MQPYENFMCVQTKAQKGTSFMSKKLRQPGDCEEACRREEMGVGYVCTCTCNDFNKTGKTSRKLNIFTKHQLASVRTPSDSGDYLDPVRLWKEALCFL